MRGAAAMSVALTGAFCFTHRAVAIEQPADVAALLEPIRSKHGIPGLAALALRGETIVAQGATGVRKAGTESKLTLADKFHLGSDTKAMTATLAALLVEEDKLRWTTTLGELFGDTAKEMPAAWRPVRFEQLLAHRSGLRANPGMLLRIRLVAMSSLVDQRRIIAQAMLGDAPEFTPGTKTAYSNTGYIVAGAALEKISGRPWEELLRERVWVPLGITSGGFGAPSADGTTAQPWGHRANGQPAGADADNPAFYGPAGTAHMTIGDWAKFVALHLRGDPANPARHVTLLKPETMAKLHTPAEGESYVAGWGVATRRWAKGDRAGDTGKVLTHSGSNTLWFCVAWLAPEIDFAVLIACNRGGDEAEKACDEAAGALIRAYAKTPGSR